MASNIKVELYARKRVDQRKEGSCVNASLARMLQTAHEYSMGSTNIDIVEKELNPEFALLSNALLNATI
jgi:hypothetical protein